MKTLFLFVSSAFAATLFSSTIDVAKYDPAMAVRTAVVTNGVQWIDGKYLPLEGKVFSDVEHYYDRLPKNVTTNVNAGVRRMKHHTAGMQFRFKTTSSFISFEWVPYVSNLAMDHMPATGVSGVDVYTQNEDGFWKWVATGRIHKPSGGIINKLKIKPGTPILINLPLYNGIKCCKLGIEEGATISALEPRKSGVTKPVVFYGTSITHGGCASRPGLAFVSIVGRKLDVPVVNLGFSGSGKMEFEMSEHLAKIDASCYVLDCILNMHNNLVPDNYEKFIRNLRRLRPGVPIIMAEGCQVRKDKPQDKRNIFIDNLYKKLIAEGWTELYYLPRDNMFVGDYEGTVDGSHPNDWGMMSMADAFGDAVGKALKLKCAK